jgi:hypothetical protein
MPDLLSPVFQRPDLLPTLSPGQWEDLLGQARCTQLLPRLSLQWDRRGWIDDVPAGPRPHLTSSLCILDRQRQEVLWELAGIGRALQGLGVPVVLLKGAAYLRAGLPPAAGRVFSDIDILVPRSHIEAAEGELLGAGWISDERDAYNQMYYRQWMHEVPPLRHVQRQSVIDLHHTIAPPTSRFKVDGARLLERIRPIGEGSAFFVLAPEDMLLHSAVHLFQEGEFDHGLRDLLDLRDLLKHFESDPDFWPTLVQRAKELGLQVPLHHALFHLHRLFGVAPPAGMAQEIDALRSHGPGRSIMARLLDLALRPNHPSCDTRWTGLARWLLYVRSHYLRMPLSLVVPHLVRKAWMQRFPKQDPKPAA